MRALLLAALLSSTMPMTIVFQTHRLWSGMWPIERPVPSAWLVPDTLLRIERRQELRLLIPIGHREIELWVFTMGFGALPYVIAAR